MGVGGLACGRTLLRLINRLQQHDLNISLFIAVSASLLSLSPSLPLPPFLPLSLSPSLPLSLPLSLSPHTHTAARGVAAAADAGGVQHHGPQSPPQGTPPPPERETEREGGREGGRNEEEIGSECVTDRTFASQSETSPLLRAGGWGGGGEGGRRRISGTYMLVPPRPPNISHPHRAPPFSFTLRPSLPRTSPSLTHSVCPPPPALPLSLAQPSARAQEAAVCSRAENKRVRTLAHPRLGGARAQETAGPAPRADAGT